MQNVTKQIWIKNVNSVGKFSWDDSKESFFFLLTTFEVQRNGNKIAFWVYFGGRGKIISK